MFKPSTPNGLLPARRVAGMAAKAASPDTSPSIATGAITSINASRPGFLSGGGTSAKLLMDRPSASPSKRGSCRSRSPSTAMDVGHSSAGGFGVASLGWFLRADHALCATTPASTKPPAIAKPICKLLIALSCYAASAKPSAASMSTATMRDTPCSCMVTPISCSAISIAILLWLMNRN